MMHKRVKELLNTLESEGKIKIWKDFEFPEPFDNGLRLKDMLEDGVDEKYYIGSEKVQKLLEQLDWENKDKQCCDMTVNQPKFKDIGNCIKARYDAGIVNQKSEGIGVVVPSPKLVGGVGDINFGKQYRQGNRVYDSESTAMCLLSQPLGNTGGNSYLYAVPCEEPNVLRYERTEYGKEIRKEYENGEVEEKIGNMREPKPRTDGICNTISTVQKDNMLCVPPTEEVTIIKVGNTSPSGKSQCNDVISPQGIFPNICAGTHGNCNPSILEQKDNIPPTETLGCGEENLCVPCLTPDRVEKRQNGRRFKEDGEPMFTLTGQDRHGVLQVGNIVDTGNFDNPQRGRIYSGEGCCPSLNTCGGGGLEPKIIQAVGDRGNHSYSIKDHAFTIPANPMSDRGQMVIEPNKNTTGGGGNELLESNECKRLGNIYGEEFGTSYAGNVWDKECISPTLMTMQGGGRQPHILEENSGGGKNTIKVTKNYIQYDLTGKGYGSQDQRAYYENGIHGTLPSNGGESKCKVIQNYRIRKLTPKECFRLQGFSDEDFKKCVDAGISNTQLYKQAGNSITVAVLEKLYAQIF